MYLVAAGYQIVVYCYNGQRFATAVGDVTGESALWLMSNCVTNTPLQSEEIANAFYQVRWYGESREFRHLIRMMLMRTNRGFRLDVSWFMQMSLPTLMAVSSGAEQSRGSAGPAGPAGPPPRVPFYSQFHLIDSQMVRTSGQYFLLLQNVNQK